MSQRRCPCLSINYNHCIQTFPFAQSLWKSGSFLPCNDAECSLFMKMQSVSKNKQSSVGMKNLKNGSRRHSAASRFARSHLPETEIREASFRKKVDAFVFDTWTEGGKTLAALLSKLPGIYPSEVLCSLRRLQQGSKISEVEVLAAELDAASIPKCSIHPVSAERRFIEHPVDFEWRFTRGGVARLCKEIERLQPKNNAKVLCLGCPSVYLEGRRTLKHIKFTLWDKNTAGMSQLDEVREVCSLDVTQMTPAPSHVDLAVIDPPWYNGYYYLFLWAIADCLPIGGKVLLSFPPEGTRVSIPENLRDFQMWCALRGFKFEKREPNCLSYRSPLFEVNALRAQGISNYPLDWRRGDLIVLRKVSTETILKPSVSALKENWEEVRVGSSRIKFCRTRQPGPAAFKPVGETEILPSVSSRHKLRRDANVVTSGNRFLMVKSINDLVRCLDKFRDMPARELNAMIAASETPQLMRKTASLISKEEKEAALYFRRIHDF